MNVKNINIGKKFKIFFKYPSSTFRFVANKIRKGIPNFPLLVTIFATDRCNLNCPMCLNASYRNTNGCKKDITFEDIKKFLPEIKKFKPLIYITGGEPLLNKDIFKIIKVFSQNKIFTSMATNGLLVEERLSEIIDSGLEYMTISLDHYLDGQHDKIRGFGGAYSATITGLKKLLAARKNIPAHLKIATVISKDNYYCLSDMYDVIETLGLDEWSIQHFSFITPEVNSKFNTEKLNESMDLIEGVLIDKKEYLSKNMVFVLLKQINMIIEKSKKYKTKFYIYPKLNDFFSYYQGKWPSKKSFCSVPFQCLTVLPDLRISLCKSFIIGDLTNTGSIMKIWQSKEAKHVQNLLVKENLLTPCFRCCHLNYSFIQ